MDFLAAPPLDLCLGFANTRYWRGSPAPTEELAAPADLLGWCERSGCWDAEQLGAVRARWQAAPAEADAALAAALAVREAVYRLFAAAPAPADLARLNAALAAAPARTTLRATDHGFVWQTPALGELTLAPVLWSAADLLAGARRDRVRTCANPQCRWVFLDDSKGGTRRWCAMSACGNRAKAHRHYARQRATRP